MDYFPFTKTLEWNDFLKYKFNSVIPDDVFITNVHNEYYLAFTKNLGSQTQINGYISCRIVNKLNLDFTKIHSTIHKAQNSGYSYAFSSKNYNVIVNDMHYIRSRLILFQL